MLFSLFRFDDPDSPSGSTDLYTLMSDGIVDHFSFFLFLGLILVL